MKTLFLIVTSFLSFASFSQTDSCSKYVEMTVDEVTGKGSIKSTKLSFPLDAGGSAITVQMSVVETSMALIISTLTDRVCIDENATINFLFTDGTRLELVGNNDFNCKGQHFSFFSGGLGNEEALRLLKTKNIKIMRVNTNEGYIQKSFTASQANQFRISFGCIAYKIGQ